jgi:hypothetical protein
MSMKNERLMGEERRNSQRLTAEIPISFRIGGNAFFGTAANLGDDGMMIEASLARRNFLRVFNAVLKTRECPVEVSYSIANKSFSRRGKIKHYHVDFSGGTSAYRLSFGVWIPKMKMRDEKEL